MPPRRTAMPTGEGIQFDADVIDFFEKFSFEAETSEHFHTMEVPALEMQKEIETVKALVFSDMELGDAGVTCLAKVRTPTRALPSCVFRPASSPGGEPAALPTRRWCDSRHPPAPTARRRSRQSSRRS